MQVHSAHSAHSAHSTLQASLALMHEVITLSLPCHWLAPALYGDTEALDASETHAFTRWLRDTRNDLGHGKPISIATIHDAPYFARYHDAAEYGVLPCMCVDVDLLVEI